MNTRKIYTLIFSFLCLSLAFTANAQQNFEAFLTGRSEVQPVTTRASGEVTAILDGNQLTVAGTFDNLSTPIDVSVAGGAHIHLGYAGENGGIEFALTPTPDPDLQGGTFEPLLNTFTLDAAQVAALQARQMYVNIHTTAYQGGEIRGQLLPEADAYYEVNLFGSNEVPSIITGASGALALELVGDELTVSGSFANLEGDFAAEVAGGAHLHFGAAGENGGIEIPLNAEVAVDLKSGIFEAENNTFILTTDQVIALQGRQLYANIHSTAYPAGEIRGQVAGEATIVFRAHLSGVNEMPAVTSGASGQVIAELNNNVLTVSGAFAGLESDVATDIAGGGHLHGARAGSNGSVEIPLNLDLGMDNRSGSLFGVDNIFELTEAQVDALYERGLYVNIHTENQQGGEIRGQLLPECMAVFTGYLSGTFEAPTIATRASGAVKAEWAGDRLTVSGTFDDLQTIVDVTIAGGAHLHVGAPGRNGGIAYNLTSDLNANLDGGAFSAEANTFTLTEAEIEALRARNFYVNIHTLDNPGGELRGQLLAEANFYLNAPLAGTGEQPAVNTEASGAVLLEVTGDSLVAIGGFQGLESDFNIEIAGGAHLHTGLAGTNGGVAIPINATLEADNRTGVFTAADNRFELSGEQLTMLRDRMFYANIHTQAEPAGEIRGQCLPLAATYFTANLRSINEVQPIRSEAGGAAQLELTGDQLVVTGSFANLESDLATDIAGGAHLHLGGPEENGGVEVPLNVTQEGEATAGAFLAASNTFTLTDDQVESVRNGDYYVNVHSTAYTGGEVRGQALPTINFFPGEAPEVVAPVEGADILLEGVVSALFGIEWTAGEDRDDLVYIWQLATDAAFENVVFETNTGSNTNLDLTFGSVDTLLENAGVMVGATVTLYHRVQASDGSVATPGDGKSVDITRGMVTSAEEPSHAGLQFELYPTVSRGQVNLRILSDRYTDGQVQVIDVQGRTHTLRNINWGPANTNVQLSTQGFAAGEYFVRLVADDRVLATRRFIVR